MTIFTVEMVGKWWKTSRKMVDVPREMMDFPRKNGGILLGKMMD
jgi:hypothetical protein